MARVPSNRILVLLLATVALGGCLAGTAPDDDTSDEIQPTGETKVFDLYIETCQNTPYPDTTFAQWCVSNTSDPGDGQVPGPTIRVTAGDRVQINVHNQMSNFDHTLHWHGLHVPYRQDGVPFITQDPIASGDTYTYDFIAKPSGTFWYHGHSGEHHVDMGHYGAFIVEPQDGPVHDYDRETTLMFSGFNKYHTTGINPASSNLPNNGNPLTFEEWARHQVEGVNRNQQYKQAITTTGVQEQRDWWPVTRTPYEPTYNTFMIDGRSFPWTEPVFIGEGETIRLRLVSVNQFVSWHLHGHYMEVTHKDGAPLPAPYKADTLLVAPGERYSVLVEGNNPGIWAMHSHTPGHVQNDQIYPGGMLTTLVYEQMKDDARRIHDTPDDQSFTAAQFAGLYR